MAGTPRTETQLLDFDALDELQREESEGVEGWVLLRPVNGLCNRLSAIVAAALLAKDLRRRLVVDWRCTPVCNCPWERLFLPCDEFLMVTRELLEQEACLVAGMKLLETLHPSVDSGHFASELARRAFLPLSLPFCGQACWLDTEAPGWRQLEGRLAGVRLEDLPTAAQLPCLTVLAFEEFYPPREDARLRCEEERSNFLVALKPTLPISRQVVSKLPADTIGVHIRRSDHAAATAHSPDSLFLEVMDEHMAAPGRSCHFFLATDDPDFEELLRKRYGKQLQSLAKRSLDRSRPEAVEAALADLLSLAQCGSILGSYESSFSRLAALYKRIPLRVLYKA